MIVSLVNFTFWLKFIQKQKYKVSTKTVTLMQDETKLGIKVWGLKQIFKKFRDEIGP